MMIARQIVDRLLEAEPLDSLEGVPDFDEFMQQHFSRDPLNPSREWRLRYKKPSSPAEARALGVNWYVKNGRKFTTSMAEPDYGGYPRKSHTLAANRNARRRSFGARDVYSTRERDWPMPNRNAFYRRRDREAEQRRTDAEAAVDAALGSGI